MENLKKPLFRVNKKQLVLPFAVGMLLCTTNVSAADELARSVYVAAQAQQNVQVSG